MAPRSTISAAKQARILAWFQSSGAAHSIKDLEKILPSVASINGMQVKDYLQALSEDSCIRVEKIGSGNWYWCFPGEERDRKKSVLGKTSEERARAQSTIEGLRRKLHEIKTTQEAEEVELLQEGSDRQALSIKFDQLSIEISALKEEIARYDNDDPRRHHELEERLEGCKARTEGWTDCIRSMEKWLTLNCGWDNEQLAQFTKTYYREDYDDDARGLKEY